MQRRKLVSGSSTGDAQAFETQSFKPGSNTLVLLFVTSARPIFGDQTPRTPAVTGNGLVSGFRRKRCSMVPTTIVG